MLGVRAYGIGLEANGFARAAADWAGPNGVLLLKGAGVLALLGILVISSERFPRLVLWGAATATSVGLLGAAANLNALLILAGLAASG